MKTGVNAGSGQRPFKSTSEVQWLNLDCQDVTLEGQLYIPDVKCDLKDKWPLDNASADFVVFHHVIEHFGCGAAPLGEAYRVLRDGGSCLVFVPDMRALAQAWLMRKMDTQLFMTNIYGAYHGDEHDRHRWGFDTGSLHQLLTHWIGRTQPFDWRNIPGAELARDWWILAMEALK